MNRYQIPKDGLNQNTVEVYVNKDPKVWIIASIMLIAMLSFFFNLPFVLSSKKIVCNKSANICSFYTKNIVQSGYKLKKEFPMSDIIGVDYTVQQKTISTNGHKRKHINDYHVRIQTHNDTILVKITNSHNFASETIKEIRSTLKYADEHEDFVLYEKKAFTK